MSQNKVKAELKARGDKMRSVFPQGPKHGKHSDIQGFANTRGLKGTVKKVSK